MTYDYTKIKLLIHGDYEIRDSSLYQREITAVGNAQVSTEQSKFGNNSIKVFTIGDFLILPLFDEIIENTTNISFSAFIFPTDIATGGVIFYVGTSDANRYLFTCYQSKLHVIVGGSFACSEPSQSLILNQWNYVCFTKLGTTYNIYVNGVNTASAVSGLTVPSLSGNAYICGNPQINTQAASTLKGYYNDIHFDIDYIIDGTIIPTNPFDMPSLPYFKLMNECVKYWDFRDGSLYDVISNEQLTAYNTPPLTTDQHGYQDNAYELNGTTQYFEATGYTPVVADIRSLTVIVKVDAVDTRNLFSIGQSSGQFPWVDLMLWENKLQLRYVTNVGSTYAGISAPLISTTQYHIITCNLPSVRTYNDTTGMEIYVDGVKQTVSGMTVGTDTPATVTGTLMLGRYSGQPLAWMDGKYSACLIFDRPLDEHEVKQLTELLQKRYIYPLQQGGLQE